MASRSRIENDPSQRPQREGVPLRLRQSPLLTQTDAARFAALVDYMRDQDSIRRIVFSKAPKAEQLDVHGHPLTGDAEARYRIRFPDQAVLQLFATTMSKARIATRDLPAETDTIAAFKEALPQAFEEARKGSS